MQQVVEAYERILNLQDDIDAVQEAAEKTIESKSAVWISMDFETDLLNEMNSQQPYMWTSTTATGAFVISDDQPEINEEGLTVRVPDTVALEILGLILRHKQQLISHEDNNI